jgi:hypothetical protein
MCLHRVFSISLGVIATLAGNALAQFSNSAPIVIPGPGSSSGTSIPVVGIGTSVTDVSVEIEGFTQTHPADVGIVLVGPTGAALALMGDCGGSQTATLINLVLSDSGFTLLPQNTALISGTYMPTQYASLGSFPSPGPGVAYKSPALVGADNFLTTFLGSDPNGTWSLYAMDPVAGDVGTIADGWGLTITAVPEPTSPCFIAAGGAYFACRRRRRA